MTNRLDPEKGDPAEILDPRPAWSGPTAYDEQATRLARRFHDNFARFAHIDPAIQAAGPRAKSRIPWP
jgi:phosphoenolpyruvate carboxykinase (ATP)